VSVDPAISLSAVERLEWSERFRSLAATAIRLRHRHADWLARAQPTDMDDGALVDIVQQVEAWIAEQPPLPIHPDSHAARQGG
jgi:hypothetical protein